MKKFIINQKQKRRVRPKNGTNTLRVATQIADRGLPLDNSLREITPCLSAHAREAESGLVYPLTPTADSLKDSFRAYSSVIAVLLYTKAGKIAIGFLKNA
jgi:hypothetical protein